MVAGVAGAGRGGYGHPVPPSLGPSIALALGAFRREAWLLAPGLLVAGLRRALGWPALAFAWGIAAEVAFQAARDRPFDLLAPLEAIASAATSPRVLGTLGGLWLAGAAAGGLLRVAWLSGALPALGGALSGGEGGPTRFAAGVAYRLPRVLAAAMLGLVVEVAGYGFSTALALGALRISAVAAGAGAGPLLAAAVALALTLAVAVPLALSVAVDAAVARAALGGEGPATAFAGAARRFLARPGTFVLAALVFGLAGALGPASVQAFGSAVTGFTAAAPPLVLLGPTLLLWVLGALVGTAVELAWLGTVAVLSWGEAR